MFAGFKLKNHYKTTFNRIITFEEIKKCPIHRPLTAAFLFVPLDYILRSGFLPLNDQVEKIIDIVEETLTPKEFKVFNESVMLLSKVMNEIKPRADWYPAGTQCSEDDPWIYRIYLTYGDLIKFPNYLSNYETAPFELHHINDIVNFSVFFNSYILPITTNYYKQLFEIKRQF